MKTGYIIAFICAATLISATTVAQNISEIEIKNPKINYEEQSLNVSMDLLLDLSSIKNTQVVVLTPYLVHGADSLALKSIGVYGRNRYYHYQRNNSLRPTESSDLEFRKSDAPEAISYSTSVEMREWMDGCKLVIARTDYGCCGESWSGGERDIVSTFNIPRLIPTFLYLQPQTEVIKTREISGSAFIDFPVNMIEIYPEYRNNISELAKITSTIDSIRGDKDITVNAVSIKGFASPEGTYENNTRLAKQRTESLRKYVEDLYQWEDGFISTSFEAEDWDGLRKFVEASTLTHKNEILAVIASSKDPDAKEASIKSSWSEDYKYMLERFYPALRHSDYKIEYSVRNYSDPKEIEEVLHSAPQKLSLEEFHLLAQSYEPGSEAFCELYETAVRMYPEDPVANLNAANTAMSRKDYERAARYLSKAGDSAEACYARGVLEMLIEDYSEAQAYLSRAQSLGITQASEALQMIENKLN